MTEAIQKLGDTAVTFYLTICHFSSKGHNKTWNFTQRS